MISYFLSIAIRITMAFLSFLVLFIFPLSFFFSRDIPTIFSCIFFFFFFSTRFLLVNLFLLQKRRSFFCLESGFGFRASGFRWFGLTVFGTFLRFLFPHRFVESEKENDKKESRQRGEGWHYSPEQKKPQQK